jgi:hypothetical protein
MAFIPSDAKWYVAELIEEIRVEGDSRSVVHRNFVLVHADSPEESYQRALDLGREHEVTYDNREGKKVTIVFRGLRDLSIIHDELEHGAELMYVRHVGLEHDEIERLVRSKDELGVFSSDADENLPDFIDGDLMRNLIARFGDPGDENE